MNTSVLKDLSDTHSPINYYHNVEFPLQRKDGKVDGICDGFANRWKCCNHTALLSLQSCSLPLLLEQSNPDAPIEMPPLKSDICNLYQCLKFDMPIRDTCLLHLGQALQCYLRGLPVESMFVWYTEFSLLQNSNTEGPNCVGIDGVLEAYFQSLRTVQLYGPTNFAPVINQVARWETHRYKSHTHAHTHPYSLIIKMSLIHTHKSENF